MPFLRLKTALLLGLGSLLLPGRALGQDSLAVESPASVGYRPGLALKLSSLPLLRSGPAVGVGVEIPLRSAWAVQPAVGIVGVRRAGPDGRGDQPANEQPAVRAQTEIRYYFSPRLKGPGKPAGRAGLYGAGELLYQQPTNLPGRARNGVTERSYGLSARLGCQTTVTTPKTRMLVDVFVGVGFRVISVRRVNVPEAGLPAAGRQNRPEGAGVLAGVALGWVLVYPEKKPKKK